MQLQPNLRKLGFIPMRILLRVKVTNNLFLNQLLPKYVGV